MKDYKKTQYSTIVGAVTIHMIDKRNGDGTVTARCGAVGKKDSGQLGCVTCPRCYDVSFGKVGIVSAGNIVAAFLLSDSTPSEAMTAVYTAFVGANLDVETRIVEPKHWERLRAAIAEIDDVEIQDFTERDAS